MTSMDLGIPGWVLRNSLHGVVWVLVVLAVQATMGRRLSAFWRHGLWWVVVARLVMPPLPTERWLGGMLAARKSGAEVRPVGAVSEGGFRRSDGIEARMNPVPAGATSGGVGAGAGEGVSATSPRAEGARAISETPGGGWGEVDTAATDRLPAPGEVGVRETAWDLGEWEPWWGGIWALGVLGVGGRIVIQNVRFASRLRRFGKAPDSRVRKIFDDCVVRMGVGPGVDLRECPELESPAVYGFRRPVVLLPSGMAEAFSAESLRHVFLHELAHVRRGDLRSNALVEVVGWLHWFNPVVRWGVRRMRADRELAADALALRSAGDSQAKAYGSTILRVLERYGAGRWGPSTVGILEDSTTVERRIRAIARYRESGRSSPWGLGLSAVLAMAVVADAPAPAKGPDDRGVLFRARFVGSRSMIERADLAKTAAVLRLAETQAWLKRGIGQLRATLDPALGIPPALESEWARWIGLALERESVWEVRHDGGGTPRWAIAVRPGARDPGVREAWTALLNRNPAGGSGPELEGRETGVWWVLGSGREVVASVGEQVAALGDSALVTEGGVGEGTWDVAGMARWLPMARTLVGEASRAETVRWRVEARDGGLRTRAVMSFSDGWRMTLAPWQVPTPWLRDPLVHFAARQGEGAGLDRFGLGPSAGGDREPSQSFEWSLAGPPWQRYFAVPMAAPGELLRRLSDHDVAEALGKTGLAAPRGEVRRAENGRRIDVLGLPYFQPFMADGVRDGAPMLVGGWFPLRPGGPTAPEGLLAQVRSRSDLVAYEWETTGRTVDAASGPGPGGATNSAARLLVGRLQQLREVEQFRRLMGSRTPGQLALGGGGTVRVPGEDWIEAALGRLGDTVTEVTKTGPTELTWTRRSATGFDAADMMAFFRWLEGAGTERGK